MVKKMRIINKNNIPISIIKLKEIMKSKSCFLWGNTSNNKCIFNHISPNYFNGIFDNNKSLWGSESEYGIKFLEPSNYPNSLIITAMGDPYSDLLSQFEEMGIRDFYFFRSDLLLERYENQEYPIYEKSVNKFIPSFLKFKYVHIINDEKFLRTLFYIYGMGWDLSDHVFVINYFNRCNPKDIYKVWDLYLKYDKEYNNILAFDGVFNIKKGLSLRQKCLKKIIINAKKIIFHGEYIPLSISKVLVQCIDEIKHKSVFIPWCSRFGCDYKIKKNIEDYLRYVPVLVLNKFGNKRLDEINKFCNFVSSKRLQLDLSYNIPLIRNPNRKHNKRPKVLISHSCFSYNKCIEAIDLLKPYLGSIEVYCIGSYGEEDYIHKVEEYGKSVFKDSFFFIHNFMTDKEYAEFIEQIDSAVFSMTQGAGMTTFNLLAFYGIKIFVVRDTDTDIFTSSRGYKTYDIDLIGKIPVNELAIPNEFYDHNFNIAKSKFDLATQIKKWQIIFGEEENELCP